jgi:hypothetical protein
VERRIYSQYALVGKSLPKLVAPIYKKHGIFKAGLFLDWHEIVGESFPDVSPVKISGSDAAGYCLYLQASPSVAAQMVYFIPNILDRIHQYFGSKVIKEIRIVNGPFLHNAPRAPLKNNSEALQKTAQSIPVITGISYPPLKAALEKLFSHVV